MKKNNVTAEDYEKLGRSVESALINDYLDLLGNTKRQIKSSLIRGIASGFGAVVGGTVVVALVVWVLHLLGGVPFIGNFLSGAGASISK